MTQKWTRTEKKSNRICEVLYDQYNMKLAETLSFLR